jgi:hypothetical protein
MPGVPGLSGSRIYPGQGRGGEPPRHGGRAAAPTNGGVVSGAAPQTTRGTWGAAAPQRQDGCRRWGMGGVGTRPRGHSPARTPCLEMHTPPGQNREPEGEDFANRADSEPSCETDREGSFASDFVVVPSALPAASYRPQHIGCAF